MQSFKSFLTESDKSSNNEHFGKAYEIATALHVHHLTGSSKNNDPAYKEKIKKLNDDGKESFSKLPEHLKQRVLSSAKSSAESYVDSLKKNHKINPEDVTEVHHTSKGIDKFSGKKSDRIQNPHDIVVKAKNGYHGASLKATSGTLSNNGIGTLDKVEHDRLNLKLSDVWANGKRKAGLEGKSAAEVKAHRNDEHVKRVNNETQHAAASHHADAFNNASLADKKAHLRHIMKTGRPDIPYDYVNGEKGKSTPSHELDHAKAIDHATSFHAKVAPGSNMAKIYDNQGRHLATVEHRPTHGAFSGIQANVKIGSMKAST